MTLKVDGLSTEYRTGDLISPHVHDAHQVVHASRGVLRVTAGEGTWVVPPGRALWVPARISHHIRCVSAVSMRTVYLSGEHAALPAGCAVWHVSTLMRELIVRLAGGADDAQTPHLLALLLMEIEKVDVAPLYLPEPADRALRIITGTLLARPDDSRTLDEWARRLGASPRTLMRRFQAQTGMTFRQWRRQLRLLAALERLAAGQPVTRVVYDVGYDSPSAFVARFRETFGVTPGRYFGPTRGQN